MTDRQQSACPVLHEQRCRVEGASGHEQVIGLGADHPNGAVPVIDLPGPDDETRSARTCSNLEDLVHGFDGDVAGGLGGRQVIVVHGVLGPAVHTVGEIADAHAGAGPAGQLLADDVPVDGVIDESRCDAVPRDDPQPRPCAHVVGVGQNIRWHVARAQHAPCTRVVDPVEFGIACAAWEYEFEVGSVGLCRERAEHQRAAADAGPYTVSTPFPEIVSSTPG